MGKLNQFDIMITTPDAVVTSGQVLHGQVLLDLGQPMKMKGKPYMYSVTFLKETLKSW